MKRSRAASVRVVLSAMAVAACVGAQVRAQNAPDFSKVEIKTNKITNNFYTLDGQGGTVGVLTGPEGVFMVDGQFAPLSQKIAAAVKQVSNGGQIRFMVNTHVHGDHTGGNENFGKMGVILVSRDELRDRLAKPNTGAPMPAAGLPLITYEGSMTFHMDGEDVHAIQISHAHTDGDTLVWFPNNNVLMTGDFYRSVGYPNIDRANGGSLNGMIEGLNTIVQITNASTKIIPGHGPTVDKQAVAWHRDMIIGVRDKIAALIKQGKSQADVLAAKPTSEFDAKVEQAAMSSERFVGQVYAELTGAK